MKILIALALLVSTHSLAAGSSVGVYADARGCADHQRGMSVVALVNGERFNFGGSCGLSFSSTFTTGKGLSCGIAAELCTRRGQEIRLSCLDGSSASFALTCAN